VRRPAIAIVGRPNVGKSTLFNVLVGGRRAIVGPERGITRDRIISTWRIDDRYSVDLIDTGGFDTLVKEGDVTQSMRVQTLRAVKDADMVLCVLDARSGVTRDDIELVNTLRESGARVIYLANKVDDEKTRINASSLYELGMDSFLEISALNKKGIGDLKDTIASFLKGLSIEGSKEEEGSIRVSILGRPNVGKSMLLNRIIGEERSIVSPVPGTTRDYVDTYVKRGPRKYIFVDTAGIRRRSRIDNTLERISVSTSLRNIRMSHVCLYLVDPMEIITEQDKRLIGITHDYGRPTLIVVNKSDLVGPEQQRVIADTIRFRLVFYKDINLVFISALTGKNVDSIYPMIDSLFDKAMTKVQTAKLNNIIQGLASASTPPQFRGRPLRFYYATQVDTMPPRFKVFTNFPNAIPDTYTRYLSTGIKKGLGLEGIPVAISFQKKNR